MKSLSTVILGILALSQGSFAATEHGYYQVDRIEVEEITDFEQLVGLDSRSVQRPVRSWRADDIQHPTQNQTPLPNPVDLFGPTDPIGEAEVILDRIIAIGSKIWKIVEKNQPVVNTKFAAISALPSGAKNWGQLENWAAPESRVYRMTYKNIYGMTMIDFAFRVAYTYGGSVNGKGLYLANVEIEPRALDVAWGYKFAAVGELVNVHNAGSSKSPVAAVEVKMNWQVGTVLKHSEESNRFYVRGDGLFKNLSDGTLPAR